MKKTFIRTDATTTTVYTTLRRNKEGGPTLVAPTAPDALNLADEAREILKHSVVSPEEK